MTPRTGLRRRYGRNGEHGQMVVLFALCLVAIIAMAGLLIDGGMAWANRRQAQAAADTAALAAAKDIVAGGDGITAAQGVALKNGFGPGKNCAGADMTANDAVQVFNPPSTGPHAGKSDYVEVITTRAMHTTFASAVGQGCWMVSARAVSSIGSSSVASCSFCSLNNTKNNHTILLQNGASLRVDGDIYTNSFSGCDGNQSQVPGSSPALYQCNLGATCVLNSWKVCGDGFDVFGTPPTPPAYISAKTISVVGGWETHDQNIVIADSRLAPPDPRTTCANSPTPPDQLLADPRASNVCIHMPPIVDPFSGVTAPNVSDYTVPTAASCPAADVSHPVKVPVAGTVLSIASGSWTICPGKYYGISITGATTKVVMQSGVYFMTNTGFIVKDGGSVDGSAGVMIFNTGGGAVNISQLQEGTDIAPNPDLSDNAYPSSPLPIVTLDSDHNPQTAPNHVKYTFTVKEDASHANFWGTVHFYDGATQLDSPSNVSCQTLVVADKNKNFTATCQVDYTIADVGPHGITAVFLSSNSSYNSIESILSPREVIKVNAVVGGTTALRAMSSGPYAGFVIWQDKTSNVNMVISPQSALPNCSGAWMTDGIPDTAPQPCGDLGGIQGTIYAGNSTAQVQVTASGLTDLQIIAGRILVTNGVNARFAFKPGEFALGNIRLVE